MTHPRSPLRALRAALFAVVCVTLAAMGHSSMSAHSVPLTSLLAAFAVTGALAWAAAGRRRGAVAVATGSTGVQGALHVIFGAGERGGLGQVFGPGQSGAPAGVTEVPTAMLADPSLAHTAHTAHAMGQAPGSGAGMLAAHLLAALACGLWLARGEAALFTLARTVGSRARTPLRLLLAAARLRLPPPPPHHPLRPTPRTRRLHGVLLTHAVSRRGPPALPVPRATTLGALV
ncbi:hypothetical protein KV205_02815 [Streptomyces sp. SKN60]|uniref:hypothetical protein n=1 Tax=Streptomyces sp. SKN60 TaxID=2855506 RepID=UPI0022468A2C|nr:hypothetical protein [Streptomyces sp. SKN60]MCX2179465.1 hypothetical protein [Streptomyces sp. SKN60]